LIAVTIDEAGNRGEDELMQQLQGRTALVTGGSGGIGVYIARALAGAGMNVVVSGRRQDALAAVVAELRGLGVQADSVTTDLHARDQVETLIDRASAALGPLDVLVNNAGVEQTSSFTRLSGEELSAMVDVNLTAPMLLTREVLPGMLERGRGHVVFISSVAGKIGTAYGAPYAATKAGLIGLNQSLRAEYLDAPVGFSVVCPGFVEGDGMYQRMTEHGVSTNRMLGSTTVQKVADEVVQAIRKDLPEVIVNSAPMRPVLALAQMAPRLVERTIPRTGVTELFRKEAVASGRAD
jgi:short-subunit dehydrogenase